MRNNGKCNNSHALKHRLKQYSAFRQNPIFLKDQNMKKYQHYIYIRGEVLPTPQQQLLPTINNPVKLTLEIQLLKLAV